MDRIWQWAWDRHPRKYSWAMTVVAIPLGMPTYLVWASLILAVEESTAYVAAAAVAVVTVIVVAYVVALPGRGWSRLVDRWAAGHDVDNAVALHATYAWVRGSIGRAVAVLPSWSLCNPSSSARSLGRPCRGSSSTASWVLPSA
jgi:adenylate cyclase